MSWTTITRWMLQALLVLAGLEMLAQLGTRLGQGCWFAEKARETYPAFYQQAPTVRWRLRTQLDIMHRATDFNVRVQTNRAGYRDPEGPMQPGGLLFAGDSFTFGWGVEVGERFSSLIAAQLAQQPATRAMPIYNTGTPGYGIVPVTHMLRENLQRARPRAVVLETWLFDWDILDTANLACFDQHLFSRQATEMHPALLRARIFAVNHLCMADLAQKLPAIVTYFRRSHALKQGAVPRELLYGGFGLDAFLAGSYPAIIADAERQWLSCMEQIVDMTECQGIPLFVILVPSAFQMDPQQLEQFKLLYGMSGPLDLQKPHRLAAAHLQRLGVRYLDLLPLLTEGYKTSKAPLYFAHDVHWTAAGHTLVAQAVREPIAALLRGKEHHASPKPLARPGSPPTCHE